MVRRLTLTVSLAASLLLARSASAVPVTPVDLDSLGLGAPIATLVDDFTTASSTTNGTNSTNVYFDGVNYVYTQTVKPSADLSFIFATEFAANGFTGVAGWSFNSATQAGAGGDGADFLVNNIGGHLQWIALPGGALGEWNAFEPITFFFTSTLPPGIRNYSLLTLLPFELGTSSGLVPAAEPGTIALFGSGLLGIYSALRRRRALKM